MTRGSARTSSGVPSAIFSPWSSTVTRSLTPITTRMSCSISRIVIPSSRADLADQVGHLARSRRGSCPAVGSSSSSSSGVAGERAGDLEPPLVAVRQVPGRVVVAALEADVAQPLARLLDAPPPPRDCAWRVRNAASTASRASGCACPPCTFSRAVMFANSRMFWNVRPIPSRDHLVGPRAAEDAGPLSRCDVPPRPDDRHEQRRRSQPDRDQDQQLAADLLSGPRRSRRRRAHEHGRKGEPEERLRPRPPGASHDRLARRT